MIEQLKGLTQSKYLLLTESGDQAIWFAITSIKAINPNPVFLIPDQSGWFSYLKYPKKIGFQLSEVKTDYGIIELNDLKEKVLDSAGFIYQNPAGYFAEQPSEEIYNVCKGKCLVIKDISGGIGDLQLSKSSDSDFLVCSFGKWKAINVGYGGFISTNSKEYFLKIQNNKAIFDKRYTEKLKSEIINLDAKMKSFYRLNAKIKRDLCRFEIFHKDKKGINVIIRYKNEKEKEAIISYCKKNALEYTLCPKYIRVNEQAISIEVKRIVPSGA